MEFLSSIQVHLLECRKNALSIYKNGNGEKENVNDF